MKTLDLLAMSCCTVPPHIPTPHICNPPPKKNRTNETPISQDDVAEKKRQVSATLKSQELLLYGPDVRPRPEQQAKTVYENSGREVFK